MTDTAQQAREIADAIMDVFQPGSRKTEHYRRMRSAVVETLVPALTTYGDARWREGVATAAECAEDWEIGGSNPHGAPQRIATTIRALVPQEKDTP
jgi:hypothetical protein